MSTQQQQSQSTLPLVAAVLTVIAVIAGIALVALDSMAATGGRKIEDAPQPPLTLTLACIALLLVAIGWVIWLVRRQGLRHLATMIATGIAAALLVLTPIFAWQAFSSDRDLTVISMTCDAEALRHTGRAPLSDCTENAVETIVLLEAVSTERIWVPDAATGNLTREFDGLPGGNWKTRLTVDGPADTVAVAAVAEQGDKQVRLGTFRPYMDAESGRLRWSAVVPVDADVSTVRVLFYQSANPAVGSASIRFDVRECSGQNLRSFDASACQPFEGSASFVIEKSPEGPRTWRQPQVSRQGSTVVVTNLEARTWEFQPDYTSIEMYTQSTDVLIIPGAMPQLEENSITAPGESTFEITIEENTGELVYTIYVFPAGPTYANAPGAERE